MSSLTFDVRPDTQGILSVKLKQKNCQDYNLLSALDLAERTFRNNPLSRDISLVVVGDCQCVRIGEADDIIYTVTGEQGHGRVDGCVYCDGVVSKSDVKSIHFSMHSCQNEVKSCFVEATEAAQDENVEALKITCNRFSIIYTTRSTPEKIVTINTKCQLYLAPVTAEGLLEKKCWLEKEKAGSRKLIEGLDYLINEYLTASDAPWWNCKFIIHGDKEIAEIISSSSTNNTPKQFILTCKGTSRFSMYPPSWQKS